MTRKSLFTLLSAIFWTAGLFLGGCGPSLAQQQIREDCMSNCSLDVMSCLESSTCVDIDGHQIPCEGECDAKKSECESNCPG
jgi:hypothetical protein